MAVDNRRTSIASSLSNNTAPLVAVGIGICVAIGVGVLLTGADPTVGLFLLPALGLVALALRSPYWLVVIGLAQLAFVPIQGNLGGIYVPNVLQFLVPLAVGAALFQALRRRDHGVLGLRLPDILIAVFGLWGIVGMFMNGRIAWKWYGNNVLFVMLWYYAVRLLPLDGRKVRRLLVILLGATALQSVLMVQESLTGGSLLYGTHSASEIIEGVAVAIGPFGFNWDAGAYLCLWPSIAIYAIVRSSHWRAKLLWVTALLLILAASSRTMQRASLVAIVLSICVCLFASKLRRTTLVILGVLAIVCLPWSMSSFGGPLSARFGQVDQSRYARRVTAINLMKSSTWNPIYGIGWQNFRRFSRGFGTEEQITAYGHQKTTVRRVAGRSELHNVWFALPVEFGLAGALIFLGILSQLVASVLRIWRKRRDGTNADGALVVAMVASLVALAGVGYYHNIHTFEAAMCIFWVFYALLTGHPHVFVQSSLTQQATLAKELLGASTEVPNREP